MSDYIKGIKVGAETKQYDYNALGNTPNLVEVDNTLSVSGKAADAKVVGNKITELNETINEINQTNTDLTNSSANAIKSVVSGEVVRVDDVSPVEHTVKVKMDGENIDPSTVTLTRFGKNILGYADDFSITQDGLTIEYDVEEQIFTINGTPEKASFPLNFGSHLFDKFSLSIGMDVALSIEHVSGTLSKESMTNVFYLGNSDSPEDGRNNWFSVPFPTSGRKTNISTATKKYLSHTWLYIGGEYDVTFTDYKFKVQLEIGTEPTDYEKFMGVKYTPTADGTVDISSVSPTMTLLTDTEGITIECEYNRDTNLVMGDVETALDSIITMQESLIGGAE